MGIPILFEDNWLLAVDKPAGLLSVPALPQQRSLTGILNRELEEKGCAYRLHPCHRLDRDTSGVMLYAKGRSLQKKLMQMFKQRLVRKKYIAFVHGALPAPHGQIKSPIEGKSALTEYRLLQEKKNFSVVRVIPFTGRTNQIRIHFKKIGHPLVGESKFAFRKDFALRASRLCLHAEELSFEHPLEARELRIKAQLPQNMSDFLNKHD